MKNDRSGPLAAHGGVYHSGTGKPEGLAYLQPRAQPGVSGHSGMERPEGLAYCSRVQPEYCGQICQPSGPFDVFSPWNPTLRVGLKICRPSGPACGLRDMSALRASLNFALYHDRNSLRKAPGDSCCCFLKAATKRGRLLNPQASAIAAWVRSVSNNSSFAFCKRTR